MMNIDLPIDPDLLRKRYETPRRPRRSLPSHMMRNALGLCAIMVLSLCDHCSHSREIQHIAARHSALLLNDDASEANDPLNHFFDQAGSPICSHQRVPSDATPFRTAIHKAHKFILAQRDQALRTWPFEQREKIATGALSHADQALVEEIYGQARSVFEFGLGDSTLIADRVGVKRYTGVDSDLVSVSQNRADIIAKDHFRFYFADMGEVARRSSITPKRVLDYQLSPLMTEHLPFDVYLVNGRWRASCLLLSFLHASARGAPHADTTVLLHNCRDQDEYQQHDDLLDVRPMTRGGDLCVYKRKLTTSNESLLRRWMQEFEQREQPQQHHAAFG